MRSRSTKRTSRRAGGGNHRNHGHSKAGSNHRGKGLALIEVQLRTGSRKRWDIATGTLHRSTTDTATGNTYRSVVHAPPSLLSHLPGELAVCLHQRGIVLKVVLVSNSPRHSSQAVRYPERPANLFVRCFMVDKRVLGHRHPFGLLTVYLADPVALGAGVSTGGVPHFPVLPIVLPLALDVPNAFVALRVHLKSVNLL